MISRPSPVDPIEKELFDALDRFLQRYVGLLNSAELPHPASSLSDLVVRGLLAKLLRLADAVLALARAGQGRESGPTLRTLLTIYVNLRFLATYARPDEAAAAYVLHSERTLADLKPRVVRAEARGDAFPTMSEEEWQRSRAAVDAQLERIELQQIAVMKKFRPPDAHGKPQEPLPWSWTGMTDRELFEHVDEADGYRFYAFHSNEVHGNVSGVGDVLTDLSDGGVDFADFEDPIVGGSLALAAKYVVLGMETFDAYQGLHQAALIATISDDHVKAVRRHRQQWHARESGRRADV